jgi:hypothetical protein
MELANFPLFSTAPEMASNAAGLVEQRVSTQGFAVSGIDSTRES